MWMEEQPQETGRTQRRRKQELNKQILNKSRKHDTKGNTGSTYDQVAESWVHGYLGPRGLITHTADTSRGQSMGQQQTKGNSWSCKSPYIVILKKQTPGKHIPSSLKTNKQVSKQKQQERFRIA